MNGGSNMKEYWSTTAWQMLCPIRFIMCIRNGSSKRSMTDQSGWIFRSAETGRDETHGKGQNQRLSEWPRCQTKSFCERSRSLRIASRYESPLQRNQMFYDVFMFSCLKRVQCTRLEFQSTWSLPEEEYIWFTGVTRPWWAWCLWWWVWTPSWTGCARHPDTHKHGLVQEHVFFTNRLGSNIVCLNRRYPTHWKHCHWEMECPSLFEGTRLRRNCLGGLGVRKSVI